VPIRIEAETGLRLLHFLDISRSDHRAFPYKNGEIVSRDRWARKRVLLIRELKMRKYGTIGPFWPTGMNKEDILNEIKAQEKKISDGLQQPGAEEYALELHELIGGYFSLNWVRRSVGFFGVPAGWIPSNVDCATSETACDGQLLAGDRR
jgi:hypothetical protein